MVERRTENPGVSGPIPLLGTMKLKEDSNSLFLLNLRRNRPSKRLLRLFSLSLQTILVEQ